ncbi:hypothetical protein [Candidatus Liberibacter americanus]|uniref:Uncharacterized protein n=1 Tax=Candidatus Liberibacter americanus str. Sao Paulo TaxID=1261131 RepID=U6B4E5_9HYPH|nr:hypothetical protein [Candidatus Liberibacter americanus]AHA27765.1 hypothetical protein lam_398 [Candidatus Liberibacter americanus str. Sao Paulo]EMS36150.1 hypothetical protein G653_02856 [Candidatus Liberibacter americanus PW_SP]
MRFCNSKRLYNLIYMQKCLRRIAEINLADTVYKRNEINILRKELMDSILSISLQNPHLACYYSKFYQFLSQNEKKMEDLQVVQENKLLFEETKFNRLTEIKDDIVILEERELDDENNQDNINQRILLNSVSHKFISS